MPTERFNRLKIDKKEYILRSASKVFALHDYNDISISQLADEAEISRGSFYLYFSDKDDCFGAVIDAHRERITRDMKNIFNHTQGVTDVVMGVFDYFSHLSPFEHKLFDKINNNVTVGVQDILYASFSNYGQTTAERIRDIMEKSGVKINEEVEEAINIIREILFSILINSLIGINIEHEEIEDMRQKLTRKLELLLKGMSQIYNCKFE